jgi:hypothetical protein
MSYPHTPSGWSKIKYGVLQGLILGPLLFLSYINDLPKVIHHKSSPLLFIVYTSILISSLNPIHFQKDITSTLNKSIYGLLLIYYHQMLIKSIIYNLQQKTIQ